MRSGMALDNRYVPIKAPYEGADHFLGRAD